METEGTITNLLGSDSIFSCRRWEQGVSERLNVSSFKSVEAREQRERETARGLPWVVWVELDVYRRRLGQGGKDEGEREGGRQGGKDLCQLHPFEGRKLVPLPSLRS